jgi:AcrR family transcriptional regulator
LVDAAEHCYAKLGINGTNMADIAAHADIARRTVYRYFANRDAMLDAVVRREVERFWSAFHATQKKFDDLGTYLVEALVFTLKHAPHTNSHRFLFNEKVLPLVNKMYIDNRQHTLDRVAVLQTIYDNHLKRGGIRPQLDLIMLCEWFNRLAVSYLAAPSPFYRTEQELRELFSNMLLPIIADTGKPTSKPAPNPTSKPTAKSRKTVARKISAKIGK